MLVQGIRLRALMKATLANDLECLVAGGILLAETQTQMRDFKLR